MFLAVTGSMGQLCSSICFDFNRTAYCKLSFVGFFVCFFLKFTYAVHAALRQTALSYGTLRQTALSLSYGTLRQTALSHCALRQTALSYGTLLKNVAVKTPDLTEVTHLLNYM